MSDAIYNVIQLGQQADTTTAVAAAVKFPIDAGAVIDGDRSPMNPEEDYGEDAAAQPGRGSYGIQAATLPLTGDDVDLLLIGAPTQVHGWRLLVRPFLTTLREQAFVGVATAAFDTRMGGPTLGTGSAAEAIAKRARAAGCRLVAPPTGFHVSEVHGHPLPGEEDRAVAWALAAAEAVAITA